MRGFAGFAALLMLLPSGSVCQTAPPHEPANRAVFTSTRTVTATHKSPDGAEWVGTNGGVRRRDPETGAWQTFTRENDLPSHEVRGFEQKDGATVAVFADGSRFDFGGAKQKASTPLPPDAPEPANHNAQAIAFFRGAMLVSTLQSGLVVRDDTGEWTQLLPPTLSTDAPRQMFVCGSSLYIRHGSGVVDRFDGMAWTKNVWANDLPRKQVSVFATAGGRIWAAQWGGVSVFDGAKWRHFLREPRLQGVPVTALLPTKNGDTLYIGTQGRGLMEMDTHTGTVRRVWNEAHGVTDDWITALIQTPDGGVIAGTFVGGAVRKTLDAARFAPVPDTDGENVTDLLPLADGGVLAATRFGVRGGLANSLVSGRTVEAQCLALSPRGEIWVGTRTGIYRVSAR